MYTHPAVLPATCVPKHVALQHLMLMRMHSGNTWLYVAPQPEEILIRCRTSEKREMLQDAGILRVDDFCEVQTADFIIRGRETSGVELDLHVHPRLNLTLSEEDRRALQILPSSNITDVPLRSVVCNMDELKGLQVQLGLEKKHLDREDEKFNYREFLSQPSTLYSGALTMFVISLVIAGVCWYFYPCGRRGRTGGNTARGSSSIEDGD